MRFYGITPIIERKNKHAEGMVINNMMYKEINCNVCQNDWRRELFDKEKDKYQLIVSNDRFPDFLCSMPNFFLREDTVHLLEQYGLTGYHLKETETIPLSRIPEDILQDLKNVYGTKDVKKISNHPPKYFLFIADGQVKLHEKSNLSVFRCEACGYTKVLTSDNKFVMNDHELLLDVSSWQGEDFFSVDYFPSAYYTTEKFYQIYQEQKLSGLQFTEIQTI